MRRGGFAPYLRSRLSGRWLLDGNRIGRRKSVRKGLIERLFPAVAFDVVAIVMILGRFALTLGSYFGSPSSAVQELASPPCSQALLPTARDLLQPRIGLSRS
jgi:hypothetical protein